MRASGILMALAGLYTTQSLASTIPPTYLGRREPSTNYALAPAVPYVGEASSSSVAAASAPSSNPSPIVNSVQPSASPKATTSNKSTQGASMSLSKLTSVGFKALGLNSNKNNGLCWIGNDGPNVNKVTNSNSEGIYFVLWGTSSAGVSTNYGISFMTSGIAPYITMGLGAGESIEISCANNVSGGMSAIYPDTSLTSFGQIKNTWAEFTWGEWGTVNISREVSMSGHPISVTNPKCTTDMTQCVFVCKNPSAETCGDAGTYEITNCTGPNKQTSETKMDGGCLYGASAQVQTTFG